MMTRDQWSLLLLTLLFLSCVAAASYELFAAFRTTPRELFHTAYDEWRQRAATRKRRGQPTHAEPDTYPENQP